jgi:hypothetical protein
MMSNRSTNQSLDGSAWDSAPFRDWLHEKMRQFQWNQTDVGKAINSPQATVGRWLRGQRPSSYYVDLLADVFGENVDYLLSLTGHRPPMGVREKPPGPEDEQRQRILALLRRVDLTVHDRADFLESNLRRWLAYDQERRGPARPRSGGS